MARLPTPGSDNGAWGDILNEFLLQTHNTDGQLKDNIITSAQIADGTVVTASLEPAVQDKIDAAAPTVDPVFTGSVTVPTPTDPTDAANKDYVDSTLAVAAPVTSVAAKTGDVTLTKSDVGLGNVDNTSDASKPVSTAVQTALNLKFDSAGGTISGPITVNASGAVNDTILSVYNQANAREEFALKRISSTGYRILGTGFQTTSAFDGNGFGVYTSTSTAQILSAKGIYLGSSYASASANIGEIRTASGVNLTLSPAGTTAITVDTAGKVGIGNTPAVALDVTGEVRSSTAGSNANSVVTVGGTQTLTNKTLIAPTITGLTSFASTPTTTSGGAAGNGTQTLATDLYIQSRGTGLITNGTGLLGNNYNWSALTYTQTDRPIGATGAFLAPSGSGNASTVATELIPVSPSKFYYMSVDARQVSGSARFYLDLTPYDADGLIISTYHYMVQANTTTTLASALNDGDTTVTLTDASNWNNASAATYLRSFIIWDWVDGKGYAWPAGTYSRNFYTDIYPIGGISGNTITLSAPWSGGTHAAGTPINNGSAGGSYMYTVSNQLLTSNYVTYGSKFGGGAMAPFSTAAATTQFPIPTTNVKPGILYNYNLITGPSQQCFGNFNLVELESGYTSFTGPTTTRTYTLPNADSTILTSNAAVTVAQGGTGRATSTTAYGLLAAGTTATGAQQTLATGSSGQILKSNGAAALPTFQTGAKADVGLANVDNTSDATKNTAVATLTNKRVTARIGTIASSSTPTPDADSHDQYNITALAGAATVGAPTGTPTDAQQLWIRIKDNGTARALSWNAIFVASSMGALLTTTVISKTHLSRFRYDSAAVKWVCISADAAGY